MQMPAPVVSIAEQLRFPLFSAFPGQQEFHFIFLRLQIQGIQNPTESNLERGSEQGMKKPESHIRWQLFLLQH